MDYRIHFGKFKPANSEKKTGVKNNFESIREIHERNDTYTIILISCYRVNKHTLNKSNYNILHSVI